jgi:DNA-binding HxlR family transcriptional regulator
VECDILRVLARGEMRFDELKSLVREGWIRD